MLKFILTHYMRTKNAVLDLQVMRARLQLPVLDVESVVDIRGMSITLIHTAKKYRSGEFWNKFKGYINCVDSDLAYNGEPKVYVGSGETLVDYDLFEDQINRIRGGDNSLGTYLGKSIYSETQVVERQKRSEQDEHQRLQELYGGGSAYDSLKRARTGEDIAAAAETRTGKDIAVDTNAVIKVVEDSAEENGKKTDAVGNAVTILTAKVDAGNMVVKESSLMHLRATAQISKQMESFEEDVSENLGGVRDCIYFANEKLDELKDGLMEDSDVKSKLLDENAHLKHLVHQVSGKQGPPVRAANMDLRKQIERLGNTVEWTKFHYESLAGKIASLQEDIKALRTQSDEILSLLRRGQDAELGDN